MPQNQSRKEQLQTCTLLAIDTHNLIQAHHQELHKLRMPFFYSYPQNSCQGSSILLGSILQRIYPYESIKIVHGRTRNPNINEHHFWLEFKSRIYDLTISQFADYFPNELYQVEMPLYAAAKHPLRNHFFYKNRYELGIAYGLFCLDYDPDALKKSTYFLMRELKKIGWSF